MSDILRTRYQKSPEDIRCHQNQRFKQLNDLLETFLSKYTHNIRKVEQCFRITDLGQLNRMKRCRQLFIPNCKI